MHGCIVLCVICESNVIQNETWWTGLRDWAGEEDVSGGSGHVIEDVEGGTGGNGQMGFLGTEEKDAAATPTRTGFHFQPERTYERYVRDPFILSFDPSLFLSTQINFIL